MGFLDTYTTKLTSETAAHLLRRATFGPTQQEISDFVGKTASEAVDILISNASYRANPAPPVELDKSRADAGQPFLTKPYDANRFQQYNMYIQYWWLGLMAEQTGRPSLLEKLAAFWQNHFVVVYTTVEDYRFMEKYLRFLRSNAFGNFKDMVVGITKDAGMLVFQDGYKNTKERPNENYGRELQELFTVGQKDFAGNHNYTEQDVKAAAQVLTGWQVTNRDVPNSTSFSVTFNADKHDTSQKVFSSKYNNKVIAGRTGSTAGDIEVGELTDMLLAHPETSKNICRKLYRWFVNPNVTQEIEDGVIIPLAGLLVQNSYSITPVLKKMLTSNIFFDQRNVGAIVKSPAEFVIGLLRIFGQPVPDMTTEYAAYYNYMNFVGGSLRLMEQNFLDQPSVFGFPAYYQTGYSRNWINGTTLGLRGSRSDTLVTPSLEIKPGYILGIDILKRLESIQPNFSDVAGTEGISCEQVLAEFSKNLFATALSQSQKDYLIDTVLMMNSSPRTTWVKEWNAYRSNPTDTVKQSNILWRCRAMLKQMLRMAEYQLF